MVLLDLASEQPVVAKVRLKYHLLPQNLTFHDIASPLHQVLDGVPEGWCPALAVFWSGGVAGVAYRFETDMFKMAWWVFVLNPSDSGRPRGGWARFIAATGLEWFSSSRMASGLS